MEGRLNPFGGELVPLIKDITLDLLQTCYQKCIFCSSDSANNQITQLEYKDVLNTIKDFVDLGGSMVELSGGEPLLYNKISELINNLKDYNLEVHLFTSGVLPIKKWNNIIDYVDKIFVNLQAPNRELHDYLTNNPGSFNNVISTIKTIKSMNKWIGTHFIPLKYNLDEIEDYIKLAIELDLDNISILRFVEQGRGKQNNLKLNPEEILQLHSIIEKYSNLTRPQFKIGCPLDFQFIFTKKRIAKPCLSGISRCLIRPNGNVIPCPAFKDSSEFVAGNIYNKSLKEIWENGAILGQIRDFNYNNLKGFCSNCNFLAVCKGRCHAQRLNEYNDFYSSPDPYCPLFLYHLTELDRKII